MPKGTKVARCVEDLKGKPGINAYAVCQSSTGENYRTGRKLKKSVKELRAQYRTKTLPPQGDEKG